jgi:8-oxo-dGTP pyrophosphatase MutT (NUDIX family)
MRVSRVVPNKVLSAGIVVVHYDGLRYRLLVLRAFDQWDFPKAQVENDADPLQTALGELEDATGIADPALHWGEDYRETVAYDDGRVSRYYLAQAPDQQVALRVPPGEGAEDYGYRWVTAEEAEDVLPPRLAIILDWVVARLAGGHQRD